MAWNYRVVITKTSDGDNYGIHEVYYDADGTPSSVSTRESAPWGASMEELRSEFKRFQIALERPPLKMSYFDERAQAAKQKREQKIREDK